MKFKLIIVIVLLIYITKVFSLEYYINSFENCDDWITINENNTIDCENNDLKTDGAILNVELDMFILYNYSFTSNYYLNQSEYKEYLFSYIKLPNYFVFNIYVEPNSYSEFGILSNKDINTKQIFFEIRNNDNEKRIIYHNAISNSIYECPLLSPEQNTTFLFERYLIFRIDEFHNITISISDTINEEVYCSFIDNSLENIIGKYVYFLNNNSNNYLDNFEFSTYFYDCTNLLYFSCVEYNECIYPNTYSYCKKAIEINDCITQFELSGDISFLGQIDCVYNNTENNTTSYKQKYNSNDIGNVLIDIVVETGIEYIKYIPLITIILLLVLVV